MATAKDEIGELKARVATLEGRLGPLDEWVKRAKLVAWVSPLVLLSLGVGAWTKLPEKIEVVLEKYVDKETQARVKELKAEFERLSDAKNVATTELSEYFVRADQPIRIRHRTPNVPNLVYLSVSDTAQNASINWQKSDDISHSTVFYIDPTKLPKP